MKTLPALLLVLSVPSCVDWARVDRGLLDAYDARVGDVVAELAAHDGGGPDAAPPVDTGPADAVALPTDTNIPDVSVPVDVASAHDALVEVDAGPDVAEAVDAPIADARDAPSPVDAGAPPADVPGSDVAPVCGPLEGLCGGACASLLVDVNHCGACGRRCPAGDHAAPSCNGGRCELACEPGFAVCGGGPCQDLRSDPRNCGACGRICPTLDHALPACAMGRCEMDCSTSGYSDCDGVRANGCESAPSSDPQNCGRCGVRCRDGQRCVLGACWG